MFMDISFYSYYVPQNGVYFKGFNVTNLDKSIWLVLPCSMALFSGGLIKFQSVIGIFVCSQVIY